MYIKEKRSLCKMPMLFDKQENMRYSFLREQRISDLSHIERGFTLVEIIIVVVILSIAAMITVPMMSSASSVQIRSATNLIAADLEYAKSMAISRGQNYSVVFDKSANSYQIEDHDGNVIQHPVKKGFPYVMDFSSDKRLGKVDITDVDFNGASSVEFNCLGSPNDGGTITINVEGTAATVSVEPVTGYISINL